MTSDRCASLTDPSAGFVALVRQTVDMIIVAVQRLRHYRANRLWPMVRTGARAGVLLELMVPLGYVPADTKPGAPRLTDLSASAAVHVLELYRKLDGWHTVVFMYAPSNLSQIAFP